MTTERADPLWPVLLLSSGVLLGTVWLESLARDSSTAALVVAVPSAENALLSDELETNEEPIQHEALEPVNEAHRELQALARKGAVDEALVGFAKLVAEHPESAAAYADYGYWLIRAKQFEQAEAQLERALALNPGSALLQMNLGAALRKQGKTGKAIEHYQEALRLRPGYIEAELALAQAWVVDGKAHKAIDVLTVSAEHGDNESRARALLALGRLELDAGSHKSAKKSFERAIQWLPGSVALRLGIARAWYNKKNAPERARRSLEATQAALRLAPGDARTLLLLGKAFELKGNRAEAADAFEKALHADPGQPYARRRLLRFALSSRDHESAERHAKALLALDEKVAEYHFLAGLVASRSGSSESARTYYQAAIDTAGGTYPEAYFNLGLLEKSEGHLERAVSMYETAIAQRPDYKEAYNNLGVSRVTTGDLDGARQAYRRALAIDEKYTSAWVNLGELYGREGNWAEAVRCLEQATKIRATDHDLELTFGDALLKNKKPERAQSVFRRLVERDPRSASAWAALARAELELGRVSDARDFADRALELADEQPEALRVRADVARRQGKLDEARQRYATLLDQAPEDTSVRLLLAQVFFEQGQLGACMSELKKILRFGGDAQEAEKWLGRCQTH